MENCDVKDDKLIERISRIAFEVGPVYASRQFEKLVNEMARREFAR